MDFYFKNITQQKADADADADQHSEPIAAHQEHYSWHHEVYCPYCSATNIERLPPSGNTSPYNFRYLCLNCHSRFNDDTKTPFDAKIPSIEQWLQCWFLLGCTESIEYIAAKLKLDPEQIKAMASELRHIFHSSHPITNLTSYENWHKINAEKFSKRINEEILNTQELYTGTTPYQPKDTAELRRQQKNKERAFKSSSRHKLPIT